MFFIFPFSLINLSDGSLILFYCFLELRQIFKCFLIFFVGCFLFFLVGHVKRYVKLNTKIARFPVKHVKLLVFIKIRIKLCLTKA